MFEFLDRLVTFALPRVRDFQGVKSSGFDGRGNYNLGITEQIIFPEIDIDKVNKIGGMDISFVTTAKTDKEAKSLLNEMGLVPSDVAYIGDDETDIPCCKTIPFSFSVNNSHIDLKRIARFNLKRNGGEGVVAEFIEKLNFLSTNLNL